MSQEERSDKNQVFNQAGPQVADGIEKRTAAQAVKAEFGLDIPTETVPLPSMGKLYPQGHPLCDKDTIDIAPMTAREEDILTSTALIKKGTVVTELIRSCIVDKNIAVETLLSGDRNALMVAVRVTGYGPEYEGEVACSACSETTTREFDLSQLEIKKSTLDPLEPNTNLFEFELPMTKKRVRFKFMTVADEDEISMTQERHKKLFKVDKGSLVTTNLLHSIVSIDGISDRSKIARFIGMMPARDSKSLREHMRKHEPGIVMRQYSRCDACGEGEEVSLPMGVKFLWPSSD